MRCDRMQQLGKRNVPIRRTQRGCHAGWKTFEVLVRIIQCVENNTDSRLVPAHAYAQVLYACCHLDLPAEDGKALASRN